MERLLKDYTPISLSEMNSVSLMNRTDIKFVTTAPVARQLLAQLRNDYFVQEIDGQRVAPYYTVYFDTDNNAMYLQHVTGHATRQKLRIRSYIQSHLNFLEVKTKDNHGRTHKNAFRSTTLIRCTPTIPSLLMATTHGVASMATSSCRCCGSNPRC